MSETPNTDKLEELVESGALDGWDKYHKIYDEIPDHIKRCLPAAPPRIVQPHQHSYIPIEWKSPLVNLLKPMPKESTTRVTKLLCTTCDEEKEL